MTLREVNERIDRLLHDAEHAFAGATFAARMGHASAANGMQIKYRMLHNEAAILYVENPGSEWPECEWPAPSRANGKKRRGDA